jgi:uncharacterized protein (TIGR00304 family)
MRMDPETLYGLGIALISAGILVIFVAIILLFISNIKGEGRVKGGGAIIIGPFPIIFGTDRQSIKTILLLSTTLTILLTILIIIAYIQGR